MKYLLNRRSFISLMILFPFFNNFGMETKEYDYLFKVVFVGDAGVGKTQIFNRYVNNIFKEKDLSTIAMEFTNKKVNFGHKKIILQLWDTAGQERFRGITRAYYKKFNLFVIVYAINDKKSFENIQSWVEDVKTQNKDAKFLLVGNKCDLEGDKRRVTKEESEEYAKKYNMKFFEVSAKTEEGIKEMFEYIIPELLEDEKEKKNKNIEKDIEFNKHEINNSQNDNNNQKKNYIKKKDFSFCDKYCSCCPCLNNSEE